MIAQTELNERSLMMSLSAQRREVASHSPEAFARVYLDHHLRLPPSRMHADLYKMLHKATQQRGQRIAVAAPRGHAKSTVVSLAYVLWSILYEHEKLIVIVSATKEQAVLLLKSIKDELQINERLLTDFPQVCYQPGTKTPPKPWRDNSIALNNGVMIRVLGAGQGLRGMKHRQHRPSLIIVDDLENQEHCESADQRHKLRDWFDKTLLKSGDERTNVIVVGTILHYDSLLANLTHPKPGPGQGVGWDRRVYQAVELFSEHPQLWEMWESIRFGDEELNGEMGPDAAAAFYQANRDKMLDGTRVLWPQREDYEDLMILRADEGRLSFQSEKQNEPLDPEMCLFSEDSFRFWDDEFDDSSEMIRAFGKKARIIGACDPSMGKRGNRGDYTAIVTVVQNTETKQMYVVDADIARRKPDETIQRIVALANTYSYRRFLFEANQFQEVMANRLKHKAQIACVSLNVKKVTNTTNKKARIESLESLVSSGKLRFSRRHKLLLEQLRQFPLGAHDDGPDALEMAVTDAVEDRTIRITYNVPGSY